MSLLLAEILTVLKKPTEARRVFEVAIRLLPRDESILSNYASLLVDQGEHAMTLWVYSKLLQIEPENPNRRTESLRHCVWEKSC